MIRNLLSMCTNRWKGWGCPRQFAHSCKREAGHSGRCVCACRAQTSKWIASAADLAKWEAIERVYAIVLPVLEDDRWDNYDYSGPYPDEVIEMLWDAGVRFDFIAEVTA